MHIAKYGKKGLGQLFSHYERKNNEHRKYSNEEIDTSKTSLNYNLAPTHKEGNYKFTVNRCKDLNILNRADVNYCCDWCVTAPQEIKDDKEKCKAFFQETYNFLSDRYREENVISAYVHNDETTPHMHFAFIPVSYSTDLEFDTDTGELSTVEKGKVSAKEVVSRKELKSIHNELQDHLDNELEFHCDIHNGGTKGVETIKQLKEKSKIQEEIKTLESERDNLKRNCIALQNYGKKIKKEKEELQEVIGNLLDSCDVIFDSDTIEDMHTRFASLQNGVNEFDTIYNNNFEKEKKLNKIKVLDNDDGLDFI